MDQSRSYQTQSIESIKAEFLQGHKKVLLWLATGGGKTFVFCKMVKDAASRGKKAIVIVRGRKLVSQASERLFREGVPHGTFMANHWNYRPRENVQVCSIDTLISRGHRPEADLIIIDEAHLATSDGYKQVLADYPNAFIVAVTATPYVDGGLRHIAESIVHPISMLQLIERGFLVPFRYFAPVTPDLTDVKISKSTKDYVTSGLESVMVSGLLTGKIIEHWKKIASDRPTICFAVNINHSLHLVEKFKDAGINAEHCDADSSDEERNAVLARLVSGETNVVCNVGIFCTGVDVPSLGAIIMARPTQSKNLFIQQAGRGTRTFDGKKNCILLDHAGNIGRHGLPTDEVEVDLDGKKKKETTENPKICKHCFAVYLGSICPECGTEPPIADQVEIEETTDELTELVDIEPDPILRTYNQLVREGQVKGRKSAWAMHKLVDRFSLEQARPYLPEWFVKSKMSSYFSQSPYRSISKT